MIIMHVKFKLMLLIFSVRKNGYSNIYTLCTQLILKLNAEPVLTGT